MGRKTDDNQFAKVPVASVIELTTIFTVSYKCWLMAETKIIFLVLPKVHLLDLAGPDQVFNEAMEQGANISLHYCSFEQQLATSSSLPFGKLQHFSKIKINKGDYLFIPGAELSYLYSPGLKKEKAVFNWVIDAHKKGAFICSVCTGAFFLALTGLLNGRRCTTHWKRVKELQQKFPALLVEENVLFTEDDQIYTSAGVAAGIDLALHITGRICDDHLSFNVARELVIYIRRKGEEEQQSIYLDYRNHIHSGIHKVQDHILTNIDKKLSLDELSVIAFMSSRNLTRTFKKEIGLSVNEYITLIRKSRAKELLKNPDLSRIDIANKCGLKSIRQLSRLLNED